jgi:pimeloyl-ACP methyl ester carboxylesterase
MVSWRRVVGSTASAVDRIVVRAMHARGAREREAAERLTHEERLEALSAIDRAYSGAAATFFGEPEAIDPTLRQVRRGVWDASWPSTTEPWLGEVAPKYLARTENRTAHARLFFGGAKSRPAVIALHGYMGGYFLLEEPQWPIAWLLRRGLDVALPILPFHALRGGARRGPPPFPSSDPRFTNEGFRQAVADVVALAEWLRERGAERVGVVGMSLGGYTSALVATVSDAVDFVMPMIPLASIADFAREQGRLGEGSEAEAQHAALERAHWIVSPLARPLRLPPSRALVVCAEHDCITPSAHAQRIAAHFGCDLSTFAGGHLLQVGRAGAFRALAAMLEREGVIAPRPPPRNRR